MWRRNTPSLNNEDNKLGNVMNTKFSELQFKPMSNGGNQAIVNVGNEYGLSIIDNGYGKEQDMYEVGTLFHGELTNVLPSLTGNDTVVGYCTPDAVEMIIGELQRHILIKRINN